MKKIIIEIFTWWNKQTIGTRFFTWKQGIFVGSDNFGNKYYCNKNRKKRWVIYSDIIEASSIPAGWHGWLHYRYYKTPDEDKRYKTKIWEKNHIPNQTGTDQAYYPQGSLLNKGIRKKISSDYIPWSPNKIN